MGASCIHPVILSGGTGTHLWPASTECLPKQFLRLTHDVSSFQQSLSRFHGMQGFAHPMVVGPERHGFLIVEQVEEQRVELDEVLLEPLARDTALSVAVAASRLATRDTSALMLVMPADHHIEQPGRMQCVPCWRPQGCVEPGGPRRAAAGVAGSCAYGEIRSGHCDADRWPWVDRHGKLAGRARFAPQGLGGQRRCRECHSPQNGGCSRLSHRRPTAGRAGHFRPAGGLHTERGPRCPRSWRIS